MPGDPFRIPAVLRISVFLSQLAAVWCLMDNQSEGEGR
jgi:hypothetical protein